MDCFDALFQFTWRYPENALERRLELVILYAFLLLDKATPLCYCFCQRVAQPPMNRVPLPNGKAPIHRKEPGLVSRRCGLDARHACIVWRVRRWLLGAFKALKNTLP